MKSRDTTLRAVLAVSVMLSIYALAFGLVFFLARRAPGAELDIDWSRAPHWLVKEWCGDDLLQMADLVEQGATPITKPYTTTYQPRPLTTPSRFCMHMIHGQPVYVECGATPTPGGGEP